MVKVEYSANNSGGNWWLTDNDWSNLEKAGWTVEWLPAPLLGTKAKSATIEVETPEEAINSFQKITGQDPWNEGCNCCGPPHNFSYVDSKGKYHFAQIAKKTSFGGWAC